MPNPTFAGYKTYLVAGFVVFVGVVEGLLGVDLPGVEVGDDWMQYVVSGLGLGSLRAAISKVIEAITGN